MMTTDKIFSPAEIETKIRQKWKKPTFETNLNNDKIFSILMPPPNVTGTLHLGHALNNYLQDALIRFHKLRGFETLWIPGFDHAGIATEILVKKWIRENKLEVNQYHSEIDYFHEWTKIKQKLIRDQWDKLGLLINYEYEEFTFSSQFQRNVAEAFVELYNQGLIYQSKKLVNWDPELQTAISNIEVRHIPKKGKLYFFKYYSPQNPQEFIPVATTRPETMFADQAIMIHPEDERYQKWIGQTVINPLTEKEIPVIVENQIDPKFGSGAVKCTPGHDFFDFKIGKKHHFKIAACFDQSGILTKMAGSFAGRDRLTSRAKIVANLTQKNAFIKEQTHNYTLPVSDRSDAIIEPFLTTQWFIKTQQWAEKILKNKKNIDFFPGKYQNRLWQWLENIEDWCVSRQLIWGHKLPIYFHNKTKKIKASLRSPGKEWTQSTDVLDTWFSSGLWSLVNFGWKNLDKEHLSKILPINYLVTSYDIIFFWVARMLFLHHHFGKILPFEKILIHGLIRTENNEKMSKSKNNVINPLNLIQDYSSDALRFYLLGQHKIGDDLTFSEEKLTQSHQFTHKLWNISQFLDKYNIQRKNNLKTAEVKEEINQWIIQEWSKCKNEVELFVSKHLLSLAIKNLTRFAIKTWSNFYLRIGWSFLKAKKETEEFEQVISAVWSDYLACLHPFLPMLTEHFYNEINKQSILKHEWLSLETENTKLLLLQKFFAIFNLLNKKTEIEQKNVEVKILTPREDFWKAAQPTLNLMLKPFGCFIYKIENFDTEKIFFNVKKEFDKPINNENINKSTDFYHREIERCENLLNNKNFMTKAKEEIIEKERTKLKKYKDLLQKISE